MRDYHFCKPIDNLLYVEVPTIESLVTLVLQRKWRKTPHLRTIEGYVPYYGGGIAFNFYNLRLKGIRPSWYLISGGNYDKALEELLDDGIYADYREAMRNYSTYPKECEWVGPPGMTFDLEDIEYIWLGHVSDMITIEEAKDLLSEILPLELIKTNEDLP